MARSRHPRRRVLLALGLAPFGHPVLGAPKAELWDRWLAHNAESREGIDHRLWDEFLGAEVRAGADGVNRIDYGRVSQTSRERLRAYIDSLARTPIRRYRRAAQLAYWINLYNAVTVEVVLEHYPVRSIRDISISPGLFSIGPWGKKLIEVEGTPLSLDDIEHRILRPIWNDPRLHYAVNCAAVGCPDLATEAFTAESAGGMLDRAAAEYVNGPRGVRLTADGRLHVSSIYVWFMEDFGNSDAGVIAHLRRYARGALATRLAAVDRISDDFYDWSLNDAARSPPVPTS